MIREQLEAVQTCLVRNQQLEQNQVHISTSLNTPTFPHLYASPFCPASNSHISGLGENKDGDEKACLKHKNGCCLWKFTTLPWKFTTRRAPGLVAGGHVDSRNGNLFPMRLYCSCCFPPLIHLTLVTQPFSWLFVYAIRGVVVRRRVRASFSPKKWAMEPQRDGVRHVNVAVLV